MPDALYSFLDYQGKTARTELNITEHWYIDTLIQYNIDTYWTLNIDDDDFGFRDIEYYWTWTELNYISDRVEIYLHEMMATLTK